MAPRLFGGVSWNRLEPDGLQWPCPDPQHPGTSSVHADGFLRGRGQLSILDFEPSPEPDVSGHPFLLITGRVLQHFNVGTMTRRTPSRQLEADDRLEIHPDDARAAGIEDGAPVRVESRWGATTARSRVSARVAPGTLFLSFHFLETHTNRFIGPQLDPQSKCPDSKVTAVRIARADAGLDPDRSGAAASRGDT